MISDEARSKNVIELKKVLRDSELKVLGYNIDGKGNCGIFTECSLCGKVSKRPFGYWVTHQGCQCQRARRISESQLLSPSDVAKLLRRGRARALSPYRGLNQKMTVECRKCGYCWDAWATSLSKGKACPECARDRIRATNLKKYGVEYSNQRPEVKAKIRQTMLDRYGVKHALQNKELFNKNLKSSFALKDYKLGNRVVRVQGYEPQALDYIQNKKKIKAKDIVCGSGSNVPSVEYKYKGKWYVYHPDIYIRSLNRLCEVKSAYTYLSDLRRNEAKRKACLKAGYNFTFLVMDGHGNRINHQDLIS